MWTIWALLVSVRVVVVQTGHSSTRQAGTALRRFTLSWCRRVSLFSFAAAPDAFLRCGVSVGASGARHQLQRVRARRSATERQNFFGASLLRLRER